MSEELKAGVGLSRKWDAREAGREVALSTLEKLDGENPKFFLLFSTIHYEKYGGFQELLNGVWDVLPEGTPLIGGTVAGFMNNYGCYTRGATALAVSYPNMDVAIGVGRNTKRNPQKAARECAMTIKEKLSNSKYKNKFIMDLISSGLVPQIPGVGRTMIIRSKILGKSALQLLNYSEKILQKGVCKQDEVLKEFTKILPDYYLLSGGATDDVTQLRNYQFFDKEVLSNSICALAINTDINITLTTTHGLLETEKKFRISDLDSTRRIIKSIDGKPAISRLFEILNLRKEDLNEQIFRKIFFLPIGFKSKNGDLVPTVAGIFLGDYFVVIFQVENEEAVILNLSGQGLLNSIDENITMPSERVDMVLISSCAMRLLALGKHTYSVYEKLKDKLGDKPFLLYYVAGEATYSERGLKYGNYTFNSAVFSH